MIVIRRFFCPGQGLIRPEELKGYVFSPESNAHTFVIEKLDGAAAVPFPSGSEVSARLIRADQETILIDGDLTDGTAAVTLPAECYQVPGRFTLHVFVETDAGVTCVYAAAGTAVQSETGCVTLPDGTAREIDEAIASIRDAISDAQDAVDDIGEAVAGVPDVIASIPQDYTDLSDSLVQLAEHGSFQISGTKYAALTSGMITSSGSITPRAYAGYAWLTDEQADASLAFDASKYKYCLYYERNGSKVAYPGWVTDSPVVIDSSLNFDRVGISLQSLTSTAMTEDDLAHALSYEAAGVRKGRLVTEEQLQAFVPGGRKQIYPDGFVSRIRPDIYYNGRFYADIDTDDYRIAGSGEVWVAMDGDDSAGDGTEENPYLTITKALTVSVPTVHIKAGTYEQGTHYATSVDFGGRNIIGHGTVILQNDASGHYPSARSSAYFENVVFKHGNATTNTAFNATCTAAGQTICFVGCTFRDAGGNGLSVTGTDAVVVNCRAFGNKLDGFNYHDKTVNGVTYVPNVLEIDCVAYNNGTSESGMDSCNGSTAHDGTKIIRLNGEYYSCYGGVIAEIARSGGEPTVSVNYGVLAHDSTGPSTYKASFWVSVNARMYLYDCQSYGGDYDLSAVNDGMIVSRRLTTGRDEPSVHKATNATVLQY